MPINTIPLLMPGELYLFRSKPSIGSNIKITSIQEFVGEDHPYYIFKLKYLKVNNMTIPVAEYLQDEESKFLKEDLNKTFFVSEYSGDIPVTGGRKSRKTGKTRKTRKTRKSK